jgi:protein-arginine kinase activator protein McsA
MNSANNSIPWTCNICKNHYDTSNGGICFRCNQPTCSGHLTKLKNDKTLNVEWVCDKCLDNQERKQIKTQLQKIYKTTINILKKNITSHWSERVPQDTFGVALL